MPNSPLRCFVIMPTGNKSEYATDPEESEKLSRDIYSQIKSRIEKARVFNKKITVSTAIYDTTPGENNRKIVKGLIESEICIADLTGNNANVLFELGMRHCFRPGLTLSIIQEHSKIPSDLLGENTYGYRASNMSELIIKLVDVIKNSFTNEFQLRGLTSIPYVLHKEARFTSSLDGYFDQHKSGDVMPCHEYWNRIKDLSEELIGLMKAGSYVPTEFIGLEYGGCEFAHFVSDFIRERIGQKIEVSDYFEEKTFGEKIKNKRNLEAISARLPANLERPNILVMDDYVLTGECGRNAKNAIKNLMPRVDVRFLPLVTQEANVLSKLFDDKYLLWNHECINRTKDEVVKIHLTNYKYFPSGKKLQTESDRNLQL